MTGETFDYHREENRQYDWRDDSENWEYNMLPTDPTNHQFYPGPAPDSCYWCSHPEVRHPG